jgi:hypothetical protein
LQPWPQAKLRLKKVVGLSSTIDVADELVNFKIMVKNGFVATPLKSMTKYKREDKKKNKKIGGRFKTSNNKGKGKQPVELGK